MMNNMKKNLRTGDMVTMRNGKKATVMLGVGSNGTDNIFRYHTSTNSFTYIDKYDDNLVHPTNSEYDVMTVYRVPNTADAKTFGDAIFNPDVMLRVGEIIAKRDEDNEVEEGGVVSTGAFTIGFSLDNLNTGDLIVFANGKYGTVFKNIPDFPNIVRFHTEKNSFMPFKRWEGSKHVSKPEYNIVSVYRAKSDDRSAIYDQIANPTAMISGGKIIFNNDSANNVGCTLKSEICYTDVDFTEALRAFLNEFLVD